MSPIEKDADSSAGAHQTNPMRPARVAEVSLRNLAATLQLEVRGLDGDDVQLTGVSLDSRAVLPGDLYAALPGARTHGASFAAAARAAGAAAILTDPAGDALLAADPQLANLPRLVVATPRAVLGAVAAMVYGATAAGADMPLFAVTGTNGKTTTSYFLASLLRSLGRTSGLIGTIEILAGAEAIPSKLTTPESTDVHALLALMRQRRLGGAAMEVSSHALEFGRVDGVVFNVAGFTNLTQDHLDLHGSMDSYFATKATLFTPEHSQHGVVLVDDPWGQQLAATIQVPVTTLATGTTHANQPAQNADWQVAALTPAGLGHQFELHGPDNAVLRVHTGLPGLFNVANAALAVVMMLASGVEPDVLQQALDTQDPLTVEVPGRMQLVGSSPASIVDFAHNPDALERALAAVRPAQGTGKLIIVFGATGERDSTKRPLMGAIAAQGADVVIVTDDDPHDEEPAGIRAAVLEGARTAAAQLAHPPVVEEVFPRAEAIFRAIELASPKDVVLVAGRGHEVFQEVAGVNYSLDDRVELKLARTRFGFEAEAETGIES